MAILNRDSIIFKMLKSRKTQKVAFNTLNKKVENAKSALLQEFETSDITIELERGPDIGSSEILPYGYGNLFSFLGFDRNKPNPVGPVRKLLETIHLMRRPIVNKNFIKFLLQVPSQDDFDKVSPMEWESGRSWINAVTYGLGGFSHYMFNLREGRFKATTRSGTALQVATNLHATSNYFSGKGYTIGMMGKFMRRLKR